MKVFPLQSKLAHVVGNITLNDDGSAIVGVTLGRLTEPEAEGGEPVFHHMNSNHYQVAAEDFQRISQTVVAVAGETFFEAMARELLNHLQVVGQVIR